MKTLSIKLPIGQTFIQAVIWLTILLLLLEGSARTPPIKERLSKYEFYGSSHPHFDIQVKNIKARAELNGKIDCIFIGSSQILDDIEPAIVEDTYLKKTGEKVTCQNFGLGDLSPITAEPLIRVLIKNYHPSTIILGVNIIDYITYSTTHGGERAHTSIMSSPWFKYQLGEFSADGWLLENSLSYRYYLGVDHYILGGNELFSDKIEENGHFIINSWDPEIATIAEQIAYFNNTFPQLAVRKDQISALASILKLQTDKTKIVVLETPVMPIWFDEKRKAQKIYPDFVNMLREMTWQTKSELWLTQTELEIPKNGWYDIFHLNSIGAVDYSVFAGEKLGDLFLRSK
jgi:hypothetical protein